jgi:HEAT repeat protein
MRTVRCAGILIALALTAAAAPVENWTPLFDGRALTGWHRAAYVNGQAEYSVEDGCIVGTTKAGTPNSFLCTDKEYANFVLELEFLAPAGMNSGIQVRSLCDPQVNKGRVHGYQVEIDPSPRGWTAGIYDEGRRGWLHNLTHIEKERGKEAAEAARMAFRPDAWNQLRVEAAGPRLRTWLNGVPVADLVDDMTPRGLIALQVHATDAATPRQIRWRNLRLQELAATAAEAPARPGPDAWEALRSWRYAEPRAALTAIEAEAGAAQGEAWDRLEARLLAVLAEAQATADARRFACGILGRRGTPRAIAGLAQCLGDPDLGTPALQALARLPHAETNPALAAALKLDLAPGPRAALIAVCGERRLEAAVPDLAPCLVSPEPEVRRAAALALGRIGTPAAEELLRSLPDTDAARPLRAEALLLCAEQARLSQAPDRAERLCRELRTAAVPEATRAGALTVLADTLGARALPDLVQALEAGPDLSLEAAAQSIGTMPGETVGREVTAALDRIPPASQAVVLTALARRRDPATAPAAAARLGSDAEPVRLAAARLLREVGNAEQVPVLAEAAGGTGPVAAAALEALARLRGDGVDAALVAGLRPEAPSARNTALLAALGQRGNPEAVPLALGLLAKTPEAETQRGYWRALRDLAGPQHLDPLLAALAGAFAEAVRREAEKTVAECLRRNPDPAAAAGRVLTALTAAPAGVRPTLVALLDGCRTPEVLASLTGLLGDPDAQCRYEAVRILAAWASPEPYDTLRDYAAATDLETHHVLALRGCLRLLDLLRDLAESERQRRLDVLAARARRDEEKELIRAARAAVRVLDLKARSGKAIVARPGGFVKGGLVYIDRTYTFTEVPELLTGAILVATAMEDKASQGSGFVTFTLTAPATVLVCYDGRAKAVAEWLKDWRRLEPVLRSTDAGCPLTLFAKAFSAGPVALSGNSPVPGVGAMYVVGVLAASSPERQ